MRALLFNDTSYEKHHGSQMVVRQIYTLANEAGIETQRSCPMRFDWRKDEQLKQDIQHADLCLINGEGTMHDDAKQAVVLAELATYCKQQGVPCFLINSVWQRNQKLVVHAANFTAIDLLDELSQRALQAQVIASSVVPDITLSYQPPLCAQAQRNGFLVNDSVFSERTCEAWQEVSRLNEKSVRFLSIKNLPVIQLGKGFPGYFSKSLARYVQSVKEYLLSFLKTYLGVIEPVSVGALSWRFCAFGLSRFLQQLSSAQGVITGRFHCVTLCFVTRTPFYAIGSNTHKIQSLLIEAGLTGRIYDSYRTALEERAVIAFSPNELEALEAFLVGCRQRAKAMFMEIVERAVPASNGHAPIQLGH